MGDLLRAMVHVSKAGYVHNFLAPETIWVCGDGSASEPWSAQPDIFAYAGSLNPTTATDVKLVEGWREYTAPEVAMGIGTGVLRDVWSLGIIFYELLSGGVYPRIMCGHFADDRDFFATMHKDFDIRSDQFFQDLQQALPGIAWVLEHMLKASPDERWNMEGVMRAFEFAREAFSMDPMPMS